MTIAQPLGVFRDPSSVMDYVQVYGRVSIKDARFGAQANNPNFDNIPAIQAAVNYVYSLGGGAVWIPTNSTFWIHPSSTNYVTTYDNVTILGGEGSALKVFNNNGDFSYIFHSASTGDRVYMENLVVDLNVQNNTSCNINTGSTAQSTLRCEHPSEVKVMNCKFLNDGSTNTILCAGGYDTANIVVSDNYFNFTRGASTAGQYDVSVIYADAFNITVSNNKFIATANDLPATAIEIASVVQNIYGNYTTYFNLGILGLLPIYSTSYALQRWDWHENSFDNMKDGFAVYTANSGNFGSTITQYSNINIHDNSVRLNPAVFNQVGSYSLMFNNALSSTFVIDNLAFESNQIFYSSDTANANRPESNIVEDNAIFFSATFSYQNVSIVDNKFNNVPSAVILFQSGVVNVTNVLIRSNRAVNAGCGLAQLSNASYKAFLNFSGTPTLSNVDVDNNKIIDTGNPANTFYLCSLSSYSTAANASQLMLRSNNQLISQYGSIGSMPTISGDDENRKNIYQWNRVTYLSSISSQPNGITLHQSDIVITPTKAYSVNGDGTTGTLQTASAGTVTGSTTSGSKTVTVNDTTNIKASDELTIAGSPNMYVVVAYVVSPTELVLTSAPSQTVSNATITFNNPSFTNIYNDHYGYAYVSSGATSVVVNHGCGTTPSAVIATPTGNVGNWWITSLSSTQFTFNCSTAPSSTTEIFWNAKV